MVATDPMDEKGQQTAPRLTIAPSYTDPATGAVYVHRDLELAINPWDVESHVGPIKRLEHFGDVESWAAYVRRFAAEGTALLTWSELGLRAVLDYHRSGAEPGRCQWTAAHPFQRSDQWQAWASLADGRRLVQRTLIESLEDLAPAIVTPDAATLMGILGKLRATSNATAETELRPDGTTRVAFTKNNAVEAGEVDLPSEIVIAIPVLKGHTQAGEDGRRIPVLYRLSVRLRVSVDDSAHLAFRLSIPGAERALEAVYADRVQLAESLLEDGQELLRAVG